MQNRKRILPLEEKSVCILIAFIKTIFQHFLKVTDFSATKSEKLVKELNIEIYIDLPVTKISDFGRSKGLFSLRAHLLGISDIYL